MKMKATVAALIIAGCGFGYISSASAQTCGALTGTISTAPTTLNGNTCGNNLNFAAICQNLDSLNGQGLDVYQLNVGNRQQFYV